MQQQTLTTENRSSFYSEEVCIGKLKNECGTLYVSQTRMCQFLIKAAFCRELGDVLPGHDCCIVNKPSPAPPPSTQLLEPPRASQRGPARDAPEDRLWPDSASWRYETWKYETRTTYFKLPSQDGTFISHFNKHTISQDFIRIFYFRCFI